MFVTCHDFSVEVNLTANPRDGEEKLRSYMMGLPTDGSSMVRMISNLSFLDMRPGFVVQFQCVSSMFLSIDLQTSYSDYSKSCPGMGPSTSRSRGSQ